MANDKSEGPTEVYDQHDFMRDLAKAKINRTTFGKLAGGYGSETVSRWSRGDVPVPKWIKSWMQMFLRLSWAEGRIATIEENLKAAGFSIGDLSDNVHGDHPEPPQAAPWRSEGPTRSSH